MQRRTKEILELSKGSATQGTFRSSNSENVGNCRLNERGTQLSPYSLLWLFSFAVSKLMWYVYNATLTCFIQTCMKSKGTALFYMFNIFLVIGQCNVVNKNS